ncbi:MAG: STAS domain-containing protein [Acidimicrobiales bacterium]
MPVNDVTGEPSVSENGELASDHWSIERVELADRTRLIARGELDAATAMDVHNGIAETTEGDIELDLSEVSFIDSSGLAAVIEGHLRLAVQQRRLIIVGRSSVVDRVLELSGVAGRLDFGSP